MNSNGSRKRPRSPRVTALEFAPGRLAQFWRAARRRDVLPRLALTLASVAAMASVMQAWAPPFKYHVGYVPGRNITAREGFDIPDPLAIGMETQKFIHFEKGETIVKAEQALTAESLEVLRAEHQAFLEKLTRVRMVERLLAVVALILSLFTLCGYYVYYRDRRLVADLRRFSITLVMAVVAVLLARWTAPDPWRAEVIPLLLFGMTFGIAYGRELALVFSLALCVLLAVADGYSLAELIVVVGVVAAAVVQINRVRSRRKLIKVGFYAGLFAPLLTIGVGLLNEQPLSTPLLTAAARNGVWTLLAGFLVTGLLPFIEGLFGVLTEISLLELGDVAHPLLQELVRRAPGTYNHSINVASIAEAAAESVGARGLLVRVGAYFHDIGKMLKPHYFVENQGNEASRHDSLVPAMSTLIIIAHIKDGADLARAHHLPEPIIEFIEQHHGTTLVEYFYRRANEQSESNPDAGQVEESSFRYPGPKPLSIEAAVLMLADAVESASRVLVEPTPARIESLVEEIAMKKLLDGQFDECDLTLKQLRVIQDSLVKSLTAVYHGRLKYPDQRTA
ncbi:MAG TPA: HDIG domain-containing protein [Pirellulales bacterium]|nr:HDIG domain-containing protein [Pirellulales bacterium]